MWKKFLRVNALRGEDTAERFWFTVGLQNKGG